MSKIRLILLAGSVGGLVFYSWALWSMEVLVPSLPSIAALLVAVPLLVGLWALTVGFLIKWTRLRDAWIWLALTVVAAAVALTVTFFVLDVLFGRALREAPVLAFLPEGNLLEAGGRAGWTYLVLLAGVIVAWKWNWLKSILRRVTNRITRRGEGSRMGSPVQQHTTFEEMRDALTPN